MRKIQRCCPEILRRLKDFILKRSRTNYSNILKVILEGTSCVHGSERVLLCNPAALQNIRTERFHELN